MSRSAFLTPAEITAHLTAAQSVEPTISLDDEGAPRFVYPVTRESEDALAALWKGFAPALERAASKAIRVSRDEAFSAATEALLRLARVHDPAQPGAFAGLVRTKAWQAVHDADLAAAPVNIEHSAYADFRRLLAENDDDPARALASTRLSGSRISPNLFLAILRVARGAVSLEALAEDGSTATPLSARASSPEDEIALQQLVTWLLTHLTATQESVIRLRFGFTDEATMNLCFSAGLHVGEVQTDAAVGEALGMGRSTVERARRTSLEALRAAIADEAR